MTLIYNFYCKCYRDVVLKLHNEIYNCNKVYKAYIVVFIFIYYFFLCICIFKLYNRIRDICIKKLNFYYLAKILTMAARQG